MRVFFNLCHPWVLSLVFVLSGGASSLYGQVSVRDSVVSMFSIELALGGHAPAGDMADRFGGNALIGGALRYKTSNNWQIGVESSFIFGERVKQEVATGIRTSRGFVIDQIGGFTELLTQERGLSVVGTVGKVIPIFGPNKNSGLVVRAGAGMLQHKIRLETRNNDVPQLEGEYLKGYDRLTNGVSLYQFVGYQYLSNRRLVNFSVGFEGYQAFTQSRRDFNFDLMQRDDTKRLDALYGLKVSWMFLLHSRASSGYYY